jgi:DNA mismatch repair ATPase MutS
MALKGFQFSIPRYARGGGFTIRGGYDASLALTKACADEIVYNDFSATENERAFILTGPNQGGKTTYSRMFGQILYFASLGLPVPCASAELTWMNGLSTHFNIEENPGAGYGRLKEELTRLKSILEAAPDGSAVILNELFSSATTYDALEMGKLILRTFTQKNCVCLYITHLFELASDGNAVSLIAEMSDGAAPVCTYKVKKSPSVKNAFAYRLLAERRLRSTDIKERINAAVIT